MAEIKKSLKISAPITPYDTNDEYPTHEAKYGKGGYRSVDTQAERDAIPLSRREIGMLVWVHADNVVYQLQEGLENANWVVFMKQQQPNEASVLISRDEPANPQPTDIWLSRDDGLMRYRNSDNTEWVYVSDEDPEDDYGEF